MPVIHVAPSWQGLSALVRCGVAAGIGPFAQGSLDQALSLAIGPGRIGPCADMFQAKVAASSGKGFRDIATAITGHDTGHFHTGPLVPGDGGPEVDNSTERFFISMDLAEGEARMVVNADMHIFPAITANRPAARAGLARALARHTVARVFKSSQFPDVEMDQVARSFAFIAVHLFGRVKIAQA